jgi:AraC family transcriptional regulator
MNRVTAILRTPAISLERFDHEPGVSHRDPELERARSHAVSFVDGGSFGLRVARPGAPGALAGTGGDWHRVTSKHLFVATPGLEFSCRHDEDEPRDVCFSVRFDEQAIESLRGEGGGPASPGVHRLNNRAAYLKLLLQEGTGERHAAEPARGEELAGALWREVAGLPTAPRPLFRGHQLASYVRRVGRVRALVEEHFAEPLSLARLAAEAHLSVFHFARVFRELEGLPPHAYVREVRLVRAERMLAAGSSVTEACFAVGFGSLSHFVTTFRRSRGVKPSAWGDFVVESAAT